MTHASATKSRFYLLDSEWEQLKLGLPQIHRGRPSNKTRRFIEAVIYRFRTGSPWRDLPSEFGPWKSVYNRFNNWSARGYFLGIFDALKKNQS
jgi:transposase